MECCPPSAWNGVRDDGETLSGISMESCPASRGIRSRAGPRADLNRIDAYYQEMVKGAIIVAAVIADQYRNKKKR